jgi:hypothetical protein
VTGALGVGTIPAEGEGVRLMWHPAKAAFRAGATQSQWDDANVGEASMAVGQRTVASGEASVAFGRSTSASGGRAMASGSLTDASGDNSAAFGARSEASGPQSFAVGSLTEASGFNSFAMGAHSSAAGTNSFAGGDGSNAAGDRSLAFGSGAEIVADAFSSVALGFDAVAGHSGSFVFGDITAGTTTVTTNAPNQFHVRASNGVRFFTAPDLSSGVVLLGGSGSWASLSDRNAKENIRPEDPEAVLQAVADLPVSSWNYKAQEASIRHVGPMAQDFHAAFGLGDGETTINTVDIDGINMLAIQALEKRTREIAHLEARLAKTESRLVELEAALQALVTQLGTDVR